MTKNRAGILGISGALLATVFGGFLLASAAPANISIFVTGQGSVSDPISVSAGEDLEFELEIAPASEATISIVDITIEDADFSLLGVFSEAECGTGENLLEGEDNEIECFWDGGFSDLEAINFSINIDTEGEYTLVIIVSEDESDEDIYEYTLNVGGAPEPFTLDAAATRDTDNNGNIDTFKLDFSSEVDAETLDVSDISIGGYVPNSIALWDGDNTSVAVGVVELSSPDTSAKPEVTASGISGVSGASIAEPQIVSVDESAPVMVSGAIAVDGASIQITFSEDIDGATLNTVSLNDFSLSENSITAVSETAPGVVTLTLSEVTSAASIDVTVGAGDIDDLSGNATVEHTIVVGDATPISIESVALTTSASEVMIGDTITLTFLLGEVASTTTVSIAGNTVSASADNATYTATYTVDASTPTGTVAFSIAVADLAGNESTASTTTDDSSLIVIETEESEEGGGGGDSAISFSIDLSSANGGLNLISLPFSPSDTAISSVLSGIASSVVAVWTYVDGSWFVYYPSNPSLSNLSTMDAGYAYFIEVSSDVTLSASGSVWGGTRTLSSGWQLVGYGQPDEATTDAVSIDTAFSSVGLAGIAYTDFVGYEAGTHTAPIAVSPGEGFWMNVATGGVTLSVTQEN